jgi:hypothetical protein
MGLTLSTLTAGALRGQLYGVTVSTPVENGTHHRLKMEHGAGAGP